MPHSEGAVIVAAPPMNALRRYRTFLLLLVAGTVAFAYFFNTWANPWRVTPSPWTSENLDEHRAIENAWNRTSKSGLVRSGTWDAAIFGSSRVDISLDPVHAIFEDYRCINLGLNAANLVENHEMFRYFIEHQEAKLVVFALDAGDLTSAPHRRNLTDFPLSPLAKGVDPLERELRYRVGIATMQSSFETLQRSLADTPAEHSPRGFRNEPPFPENQRLLISKLYTATTIRLARDRSKLDGISAEKAALLEDIIRSCHERDIRLIFLITPNHALFQLAFPLLDSPDPYFARDREELLTVIERVYGSERADEVEVWDFLDAHPINCEPLPPADQPGAHMENWPDIFHVTPEIGNRMLDRMNGKPGDYGTELDPDHLTERINIIEQGLASYAETHPEDVRFLRESLASFEND